MEENDSLQKDRVEEIVQWALTLYMIDPVQSVAPHMILQVYKSDPLV